MTNSVNPTTFLTCGHPMHLKCFKSIVSVSVKSCISEYFEIQARNALQCPTCLKAVADMSAQYEIIEGYVDSIEIPETYRNWTDVVLCNDCLANFFFQAEDGIRDGRVTGVQTCALPI